MKSFSAKTIGLIGVGIAFFAIGTIIAVASGSGFHGRRGGPGFGPGFGERGFPGEFLVEKIGKELGLSDEQKTQAKQILSDSKTRVEPLIEAMRESHKQIKDQGTDGIFDEAKVSEFANQQAENTKTLIFEKEKTKAQLFAILTPEQREKAKAMQDKFAGRMKHGFGGGPKERRNSEE